MDLAEAATILRARGLVVQITPNHISAVAEAREPPGEFAKHGVTVIYDFGFSVYRVEDEWAFRTAPPAPTESFPDLDGAVARALRYHDEHLERKGPSKDAT